MDPSPAELAEVEPSVEHDRTAHVLNRLSEPQASDDAARRLALLAYKRGKLDRALFLARRDGLTELGDAIEEVQQRYFEARDARGERDLEAAMSHLRAALTLDRRLTGKESRLGREIRRELSRVSTTRGVELLRQRDRQGAQMAFFAATELDPKNKVAAKKLRMLTRDGRIASRAALRSRMAAR